MCVAYKLISSIFDLYLSKLLGNGQNATEDVVKVAAFRGDEGEATLSIYNDLTNRMLIDLRNHLFIAIARVPVS